MQQHVNLMSSPNMSVLNIGYGLGIVDRLFQSAGAAHHTIIEAHPQVLEYIRQKGVDKLPGVRILEGRWQDWVPEKMEELLGGTPEGGFDAVFMDTFAEGYEGASCFVSGLAVPWRPGGSSTSHRASSSRFAPLSGRVLTGHNVRAMGPAC